MGLVAEPDLNAILNEGSIIDNRRSVAGNRVMLKDVLKSVSRDSDGLKCAVGYFYFEGLALVIDSLRNLREIKILMGIETTKLTKEELIKTFKNDINSIGETKENISAIIHFHKLVKESQKLWK